MIEFLSLIAQNSTSLQGLSTTRLGLTVIGIATILVAYGTIIANPKDPNKAIPNKYIYPISILIALIGLAVIVYAWIA